MLSTLLKEIKILNMGFVKIKLLSYYLEIFFYKSFDCYLYIRIKISELGNKYLTYISNIVLLSFNSHSKF